MVYFWFSPYGLHFVYNIPYGTIFHFPLQGEGVASHLPPPHALLPRPVLARATIVSPFPTFPPPRYVNYVLQYRTGFLHVIPYGLQVRNRDTFPFPSLVQHRTVFPTQPVGTSPCNTVRASNRHRTFTYPYIPYGCLQTTVRDFLCIYRTGFFFRRRFPTSLKFGRFKRHF